MELEHGMADIEPGLRLHYVTAGQGSRTIVLLHGFPQTWWMWRHLMPDLAAAGFRVVAPDYRGAGASFRTAGGYDKWTMAGDINTLLHEHLGVEGPIVLVGHDIGVKLAFAYAARFRDAVEQLVLVDAPIPGTEVFERLGNDPRVWHWKFHGVRDLAELLVAGKEREYVEAFFAARIFNVGAITQEDLDVYVAAYSAPGAMRAGFEVYRAFEKDVRDNRESLERDGKLTIPVLTVGGMLSTSGPVLEEMAREVADDVTGVRIPGTAHWVPEEQPEAFLKELLTFTGKPVAA